jgi:hypothetical protein
MNSTVRSSASELDGMLHFRLIPSINVGSIAQNVHIDQTFRTHLRCFPVNIDWAAKAEIREFDDTVNELATRKSPLFLSQMGPLILDFCILLRV